MKKKKENTYRTSLPHMWSTIHTNCGICLDEKLTILSLFVMILLCKTHSDLHFRSTLEMDPPL